MPNFFQRRSHNASHPGLAVAAGAASSLMATRAVLPYVLTEAMNRALKKTPGFQGRVEGIELHLWRGIVALHGVAIDQVVDHRITRLATIDRLYLQVSWKRLMKGAVVVDVEMDHPRAAIDWNALAAHKAVPAHATNGSGKGEVSWQEKILKLPAFQFNLLIRRGVLQVRHLPGQGPADVEVSDLNLKLQNLTNSTRLSSTLMARALCTARLLSRGRLRLEAQAYPLAQKPTFNADLKVQNVDLRDLAPFARHHAKLDIKSGVLEAYVETAAKDGQLKGYAKPVIEKLAVDKLKSEGFASTAKAGVVAAVAALLESRKEDRIATRLELDGPLTDPDVDQLGAIGLILRNAFAKAVHVGLENRVLLEAHGPDESSAEIHAAKGQKSRFRKGLELVKETAKRWAYDQSPRMAAALSYYTAFSIAPLLLIVISIAGLVFGREAAQGQIVDQLGGLVGTQSAAAIQSMLQAANHPTRGVIATIIGVVSLIAGASGVLSELKAALNRIWRTEEPSGIPALVKQNLKIFGIIAAVGFLLLVSLALSAGMAALGKMMGGALPVPEAVMQLINALVSFGVTTVLFAMMYKVLPNTVVAWRDVWIGSAVTSLLFTLGKMALGVYLGKGTVGSAYGSAGSILIVLLWVYYSGLIVYFGAEFTAVYSEWYGSRKHIGIDKSIEMKKAA